MGAVHPTVPAGLAEALVVRSGIRAAIETGTFHATGALLLRTLVPQVWSIDLSKQFHDRAVAAHGATPGLTFLHGSSDRVLTDLAATVAEPVLFWLDAHAGTELYDIDDDVPQCPLLGELTAIRGFAAAAASCILVDDARAFLGPLVGPQITHRSADWPTLAEIVDALRWDCDRYITVLDDVIVAVPPDLRQVVEEWWIAQLRSRNGKEAHAFLLEQAVDPPVGVAAMRLVKSVLPAPVRRAVARRRAR